MREFAYTVHTVGGDTVTLRGNMDDKVQPASDTQPAIERPRRDLHRILIPQPMSATPTDARKPPQPRLANGERIQVTVHYTEHGEIVERWQLSDTDVRWYRLEAWKDRWVTLKLEKRVSTDGD